MNFLLGPLAMTLLAPPETPERLAGRLVADRQRITSYHLVVEVKIAELTGPEAADGLSRWEGVYEVWSNGAKFRTDKLTRQCTEQPHRTRVRDIYCRDCERKGLVLRTAQGAGFVTPVTFEKPSTNTDVDDDEYRIDWRFIGLKNKGIKSYRTGRPDDEILRMGKRGDVQFTDLREGGREVVALTGRGGPGGAPAAEHTIKFAPAMADNPVEILLAVDKYRSRTTVDYQQVAGIWYPKNLRYLSTFGVATPVDITMNFVKVELNTDIPESVFQLASMNLTPGTPVALPEIPDHDKQPVWRDGKIDRDYTRRQQAQDAFGMMQDAKASTPVPDHAPGLVDRRWPYFVAAAFLACSGLFLVRKMRPERAPAERM